MKKPKGKFYTVRFTYFLTGEVIEKEFYRVRIGSTINTELERHGYSKQCIGDTVGVTILHEYTVIEELRMRLEALKRKPYGAKYQYRNLEFDCKRIQTCMELLDVYNIGDIRGFNYDYNN